MKNTRRIPTIVAAVCLVAILSAAQSLQAEVITLASVLDAPHVESLEEALSAQGKTLTAADDLVLIGRFNTTARDQGAGGLICANLEIRSRSNSPKDLGALFLQASPLTVEDTINIEAGTLTKNTRSLKFQALRLGRSGCLEVIINPGKASGDSLDCAQGSSLIFKLFDETSLSTLESPGYCALNLSGDASFANGSRVILQFLKDAPPQAIAPGQYLLVKSGSITGAPELAVKIGSEAVPNDRFSLRQEEGNLLLQVGP